MEERKQEQFGPRIVKFEEANWTFYLKKINIESSQAFNFQFRKNKNK